MPIPSLVHAAVEASRAGTGISVSEDPGRLQVVGVMPRAALDAWQTVLDQRPAWLDLAFVDPSLDHIAPREGRDGEELRVTASFSPRAGAIHLFTPEGWTSVLHDDEAISAVGEVHLAFLRHGFTTRGFPVTPWGDTPEAGTAGSGEAAPRRLVRSQSPDLMAPSRIDPWIALRCPDQQDTAWSRWKSAAAAALTRAVPTDLYREADTDRVVIAGQPTRRLDLGTAESALPAFDALQTAASWIYLESTDAEVRHTFLASELAREWPAELPFRAGLERRLSPALDSARLLYKAHLRTGSKDTLKALADLRKTLADEVGKVMSQAKDLASGVWRDVAISIGVLAVRFTLDAAKAVSVAPSFAAIFGLVAVYVTVSYAINVSVNRRFLRSAKEARTSWRSKLYGFLDDADYGALAEAPIGEALKAYLSVERQTTSIVVILVVGLSLTSAGEAGLLNLPNWAEARSQMDRAWSRSLERAEVRWRSVIAH